ncbi:hypothetical protein D3C73_1422150 [compost metagenome]
MATDWVAGTSMRISDNPLPCLSSVAAAVRSDSASSVTFTAGLPFSSFVSVVVPVTVTPLSVSVGAGVGAGPDVPPEG